VLGAIVQSLVIGFLIGGLARWAVPGPDPMPIWLTVLFGLVGSFIGSGIAVVAFGRELDSGTAFSAWLFSILAASLLVIGYRRFVQHRPITGPEAYRPPPGKAGKAGKSAGGIFASPAKRAYERENTTEQLRKLGELHDEGVLSDEEFERKKAELLARM
jgi:uncharacterized membrane protein YeaQ/YmgE (transglycosylase-associated protein family)